MPYSSSRLTDLLRTTLGSNVRTTVVHILNKLRALMSAMLQVVTALDAPRHMAETIGSCLSCIVYLPTSVCLIGSLRFAEACSRVENRSKVLLAT